MDHKRIAINSKWWKTFWYVHEFYVEDVNGYLKAAKRQKIKQSKRVLSKKKRMFWNSAECMKIFFLLVKYDQTKFI